MALEEYRDPILEALITMLEEHGPQELKGRYIYGDTMAPPKEELPVVSVAREDTLVQSDSNMQDTHRTAIVMAVIVDWTEQLNQSYDLTTGTAKLYELMEMRETDKNSPLYFAVKPGTLVHAIRKNQKLADNLFISIRDDGLRVDYGLGWEKRGDNIFSTEGLLRFNIELSQPKPEYYPT